MSTSAKQAERASQHTAKSELGEGGDDGGAEQGAADGQGHGGARVVRATSQARHLVEPDEPKEQLGCTQQHTANTERQKLARAVCLPTVTWCLLAAPFTTSQALTPYNPRHLLLPSLKAVLAAPFTTSHTLNP